MRDTTERPEGVTSGTAKLVGVDTDEIVNSLSQLIENTSEYQKMVDNISPYGDGMASEKIGGIFQPDINKSLYHFIIMDCKSLKSI